MNFRGSFETAMTKRYRWFPAIRSKSRAEITRPKGYEIDLIWCVHRRWTATDKNNNDLTSSICPPSINGQDEPWSRRHPTSNRGRAITIRRLFTSTYLNPSSRIRWPSPFFFTRGHRAVIVPILRRRPPIRSPSSLGDPHSTWSQVVRWTGSWPSGRHQGQWGRKAARATPQYTRSATTVCCSCRALVSE
jgi:hypothetical protein